MVVMAAVAPSRCVRACFRLVSSFSCVLPTVPSSVCGVEGVALLEEEERSRATFAAATTGGLPGPRGLPPALPAPPLLLLLPLLVV
uniref:Putative secreted protein n=1 Tax=Anopheles darlingi TaxID=43151 RepID=A0A2M4DC78_ANODA